MPKERHAPAAKLATITTLALLMITQCPGVVSAQEMANKKACAELTKAGELLRRRAEDEAKSPKNSAKAESMRTIGEKSSTAAKKLNELEQAREDAQQRFTTR